MYCSNNSRIITNIRHVTHIDLSICAAYAYAAYHVYKSENFDSTAFPLRVLVAKIGLAKTNDRAKINDMENQVCIDSQFK